MNQAGLSSLSLLSKFFLNRTTLLCSSTRYIQQFQNTFATSAESQEEAETTNGGQGKKKIDPAKDRTQVIPVETSIRYIQSQAYKDTYGDKPVWVPFRRNFKGQFPPKRTRKTCVRGGELQTGNACPICRDEYLVLDYQNVDLLKQFISPFNGEILGIEKTGLCRRQNFKLLVAIEKAKDYGTLTFDVPFRDYSHFDYKSLVVKSEEGKKNKVDE